MGCSTITSAYGGQSACAVKTVAPTTTSAPASTGTLPFTGLNLLVIVVIALAIISLGLFLKRLAR